MEENTYYCCNNLPVWYTWLCFAWGVSDDRALLIQRARKNKLEWTRWCILITDIVSRRLCLDFSYSFPDDAAGGKGFADLHRAILPLRLCPVSKALLRMLREVGAVTPHAGRFLRAAHWRKTGFPAAFTHNFLLLRENPSLHGLEAPCLLLKPSLLSHSCTDPHLS